MPPLIRRFSDLKLSNKFLFFSLTTFVLAVIVSGVIYYLVKQAILESIESELRNTTSTIQSLVTTATDVSIKNYLRAAAVKNRDIISHVYNRFERGELTESQARQRAEQLLLSQSIGSTGYVYCLSSQGTAVVHPRTDVEGKNFAKRGFIQKQIKRKTGYLEYDWKNPAEAEPRPKALYMSYFEPWDWIISVTSYRSEFTELVKVEDFRERVLSLRFGESGYCFIIDRQGNVVVHPELEGNLYQAQDVSGRRFIEEMCRKKRGMLTYSWKNPSEPEARKKLVVFDYIPEFDWIVGSSSYVQEAYAPLDRIGVFILLLLGGFLSLIVAITVWIRSRVTSPLDALMQRMALAADGDLSVRMQPRGRDEIGDVARYFNTFMDRLLKSRRALREEIRERRLAEQRYRSIFDNSDLGIFRITADGTLSEVNPAMAAMFGYASVEECMRRPERIFSGLFGTSGTLEEVSRVFQELSGPQFFELQLPETEEEARHCLVHMRIIRDAFSGSDSLEGFVQEVTELKRAEEERRRLEQQLSQSQKLEAVGTLAGGIAHEFNNILQAIFGNVQLLLAKIPADAKEHKYLKELDNSSRRAGELVRHLLTFSHKSEPKSELVCLNQNITYSIDLLGRTLPKSVRLDTDLQQGLPAVLADPFQLEQILVNLVKNAADAMPEGGGVVIRTEETVLDPESSWSSLGLLPGRYVCLTVEDSGHGMDAQTKQKIFDPFFTTKDVGKGTGLGLSMVYKMIISMGGHISVTSQPDQGTTVEILLPAHDDPAPCLEPSTSQVQEDKGEESILVVDDEPALLDVAAEALRAQGYAVDTAESCEQALEHIQDKADMVDLIVLDLGMPGMGGEEFLQVLHAKGLSLKIVISSGYSAEDMDFDCASFGVCAFLSKPYTLKGLLTTVRAVLDDVPLTDDESAS
jgi:PAS domain S-box-containing protein